MKKAYRLYASKFHPDRQNGDLFFGERFIEIKQTYDVLIDSEVRRRYDEGAARQANSKRNE
ncbi:MAG: DnaJ domain-containing protein [Cyclonatronaceae bacterium]